MNYRLLFVARRVPCHSTFECVADDRKAICRSLRRTLHTRYCVSASSRLSIYDLQYVWAIGGPRKMIRWAWWLWRVGDLKYGKNFVSIPLPNISYLLYVTHYVRVRFRVPLFFHDYLHIWLRLFRLFSHMISISTWVPQVWQVLGSWSVLFNLDLCTQFQVGVFLLLWNACPTTNRRLPSTKHSTVVLLSRI